jgi:para-nitrobenzyl esterase
MNFIKYICFIVLIKQCQFQTVKVTTKYGDVVGSIDKSTNNKVFLGIPYAKPPVGILRFKPPTAPDSWATKSLDASKISPICIQAYDNYISEDLLKTQSEDCLYLNVWAPQNTNEPLAVMVWIHGGTLKTGGTAEPYYN